MFTRLMLMCINIVFPPLAVMLVCGLETDLIVNCILFICAVIPSHIHSFYITWTYLSRKKKVRRGQFPGEWRGGIFSEKVQYGGASRSEYLRLKAGKEEPEPALQRLWGSRSDWRNRRKIETWDDGMSEKLGGSESSGNTTSNGYNSTTDRTSIYARPHPSRRNTANVSRRYSAGSNSQITQGDNIRPAMSRRHSSNNNTRRSIYDRQGVAPPISRTTSGRGRARDRRSHVERESDSGSSGRDISPILPRSASGRRVF